MSSQPQRILLAPLDWGLGHVSRCLPLISELLSGGHSVIFAGNEWQRNYIKEIFSSIEIIHLEGYNVRYSKSSSGLMFSLFYQMPGIIKKIRKEHDWLLKLAESQKISGIISDNRYGLFHPSVPSVIITHQLQVRTGMGAPADLMLRKLHYKFLGRFRECWIPDLEGFPNLSGSLGHPEKTPPNTSYIGLLSQFAGKENISQQEHLLVLLSGPEPQRTILSESLWSQCCRMERKIVFVEGANEIKKTSAIPKHITYYQQLATEELLPLVAGASMVICRSGYSTLMDLIALNKKAVLIPTPGQTEQEYLASHLHYQGIFFSSNQKGFDLAKSIREASLFPFRKPALEAGFFLFKEKLNTWLKGLGSPERTI